MNSDTGLWTESEAKIYEIYVSEITGDQERFHWLLEPDI